MTKVLKHPCIGIPSPSLSVPSTLRIAGALATMPTPLVITTCRFLIEKDPTGFNRSEESVALARGEY